MAPLKIPLQVYCPSCKVGNHPGSPYCSRCGAPLSHVAAAQGHEGDPTSAKPPESAAPTAAAYNDGQDPAVVKQAFDKASKLLMVGEEIAYIAVAVKSGVGHAPDCAVATNKRLIVFKKKMLGSSTQDDCSWRDIYNAEMKEARNGVTFVLHAIQGWQLVVESLPKAQAWRLYDLALQCSERLRETLKKEPEQAHSVLDSGVATTPTTIPQEQPYMATPQLTQPMATQALASAPLLAAQTFSAPLSSAPLATAALPPDFELRPRTEIPVEQPRQELQPPAQPRYDSAPLIQRAGLGPAPQPAQPARPLVSGPLSARMAQALSGPQVDQNAASGPLLHAFTGEQQFSGSLNRHASQQQVRYSESSYSQPSQPLSQAPVQPEVRQMYQPAPSVANEAAQVAARPIEMPSVPLHESVLQDILRASRHEADEAAAAQQSLAAAFQAPPQVAPQELVFQEYSAPPIPEEVRISPQVYQGAPPSSPLSQALSASQANAGQSAPMYDVEDGDVLTGQLMTQILNRGENLDTDLLFQGERQTGRITLGEQKQPSQSRAPRSKAQASSTASSTGTSKKAASAEDPVKKMKQLKEMIDAGLINEEDYELKKSEILSRL